MTYQLKQKITQMRRDGFSYAKVADALGISENTVKSFCRRNGLGGIGADIVTQSDGALCQNCKVPLTHTAGAKKKRFCSDKCRMAWWNAHPEAVHRKAVYTFHCAYCGLQFESYGNRKRKYCSRACYGKSKVIHHE